MKRKVFVTLVILIVVFVVLVGAINAYVFYKGNRYIISSIDALPRAEVAIVPGAAILKNKMLSPVLKDRVDMAIELYKDNKVSKILMTGNNDSLTYDEVSPVRKYLLDAGIPAEDIFLDHAGFDTYSSMYRAQAVFDVQSAIIVSQTFHLPRALYIARSLGINAYGFSADRGDYSIKNYLRELLARPKAFIDVLFKRVPKYLGASFPITGNGQPTWY